MAEARRRAAEIVDERAAQAAWLESLPPAHRTVADVALRLHSKFVVPKRLVTACYPLAFFLCLYLWREHQVRTRAVVGFVCDETSPVQMSHAWLEFDGAKTDVSLTITEYPRYAPTGGPNLIVAEWPPELWPQPHAGNLHGFLVVPNHGQLTSTKPNRHHSGQHNVPD